MTVLYEKYIIKSQYTAPASQLNTDINKIHMLINKGESMRIATILSGIILIGTGIWCFAHPGETFLPLAFILGIVILVSGINNIISFTVYRKLTEHAFWQLADGILSVVLSGIIISGLLITDSIAVIFFGMWIMFSGVLKITASFVIKKMKIYGWYWVLIFGVLSLIAGVCAFVNPLADGLAVVMIIGGAFVLQGANLMIMGVQMKKV